MNLIHIMHPLNSCHWTQDYELYLAQELDKHATSAMCEQIRSKNNFKILDNGCYENDAVNLDVLFRQADAIGATEIILPDVMGDFYGTLKATTDALEWALTHGKYDYKFMAVCQGRTWEEYESCVQLFKGIKEITCIGVPKKFCRAEYIERAGDVASGAREAALARGLFAEQVAQMVDGQKDIHLLGLSWNVLELPQVSKFVRTCDTNNIVENVKRKNHAIASWATSGENYSLDTPMTAEELFVVRQHAEALHTYINGSEGFR